ncbi:MAG: LacI family transcriptional regulator, partial [Clostridiales bacterium]|nr:LacI family transcriptional regulator [Clostridiales bacterium]
SKLSDTLKEEYRRTIQERTCGTILVLFNRSKSLFWNKILTGISDEINTNGCRMQLHIVDEDDINGRETVKLVADDIIGIIFLCEFPMSFVEGMAKAGLPMTFFNAPANPIDFLKFGDVVTLEGRFAVSTLVQHAIDMGKRKFAFIGYILHSSNVRDRYDGFLDALSRNDIKPDKNMLFIEKAQHSYYDYQVVENLVYSMKELPEVFVCTNDDIARYVATALMKKDLKKALEMVLIGFDNTVEPEFFKSDIMTVEIHKEEVGRRLVKTTLDKVKDKKMDNAMITLSTYPIIKRNL